MEPIRDHTSEILMRIRRAASGHYLVEVQARPEEWRLITTRSTLWGARRAAKQARRRLERPFVEPA